MHVLSRTRQALAAALVALMALAVATPGAAPRDGALVRVLVEAPAAASAGVAEAVTAVGGRVEAVLGTLGITVAEVPEHAVDDVASVPGVVRVAPDAPIQLQAADAMVAGELAPADTTAPQALGAPDLWAQGVDGTGVGIAVVDTGVAEVPELAGRVAPGIDLTGERDGVDRFGHGTPVAGLAAGTTTGVAPGSHVVPVRIGDAEGRTDVARLLIALDWVVRASDDLDIRVLNLSLGSTEGPVDIVTAAVQQVWDHGIVVVVAAGNDGPGNLGTPGDDTLVATVGATLGNATASAADDVLAEWSSTGVDADGRSKPDVVAPGQSLVAPGAPGSWAYDNHPEGHVADGLQRVSGTSFSAGLLSGSAALLLDANPDWTPDQVLGALTASTVPAAGSEAGTPWLPAADSLADPAPANTDATRADTTALVELGPPPAKVFVDLLGNARDVAPRGGARAQGQAKGAPANGGNGRGNAAPPAGDGFDGSSWYGSSWYGSSWYGSSWYGSSWYGSSWYGSSWYGSSWYSGAWS